MYRSHVLVCGGTGCTSSNSPAIIEALEKEIADKGLENEIKVIKTGCFGLCALGPIMIVYPEGCFYSEVKVEDVPTLAGYIFNGWYANELKTGMPIPSTVRYGDPYEYYYASWSEA